MNFFKQHERTHAGGLGIETEPGPHYVRHLSFNPPRRIERRQRVLRYQSDSARQQFAHTQPGQSDDLCTAEPDAPGSHTHSRRQHAQHRLGNHGFARARHADKAMDLTSCYTD